DEKLNLDQFSQARTEKYWPRSTEFARLVLPPHCRKHDLAALIACTELVKVRPSPLDRCCIGCAPLRWAGILEGLTGKGTHERIPPPQRPTNRSIPVR